MFSTGELKHNLWSYKSLLALAALFLGLFIARFSLLNTYLAISVLLIVLGSIIEPLTGIAAALFFGLGWAWLRAELPQIPALIGQYVLFLAVAIWLGRGLVHRDIRVRFPPLLSSLLLFMGVASFSLWLTVDIWVGFMEWLKWVQILLVFLVTYDSLVEDAGRQKVMILLVVLAGILLFQSGIGLWQSGLRGTGPEHFAINDQFYRAYGTFEQPNPYAGFVGMVTALFSGLVIADAGDWLLACLKGEGGPPGEFLRFVVVVAPVCIVGAGALLASWSRGGWLGFAAALLAIVAALPRRGWLGIILAVVAVSLGLGLYTAGALPASIADRMTSFLSYTSFEDVRGTGINDANYAVIERMAHWQAALDMWREHFWLGVGFGCYEPAYPAYSLINWPIALGHAHNYYLNLLAETGILGLGAYLVWLICVFWQLWSVAHRTAGWLRGLSLGLIGAWTHFVVHNLVDNLLVNNVHLYVGVFLALSAWLVVQDSSIKR
ncbi:MAG: O-antigen ligase family protein [Anaerolineae bacterium]|nr:O-antigen ligase family protein [Anaerolineae bacterium]